MDSSILFTGCERIGLRLLRIRIYSLVLITKNLVNFKTDRHGKEFYHDGLPELDPAQGLFLHKHRWTCRWNCCGFATSSVCGL
jgi:hypothetical protein